VMPVCAPGLEALTIPHVPAGVSLVALGRLPHLRTLVLRHGADPWCAAFRNELRALPQLTWLEFWAPPPEQLAALLQLPLPHALQWQQLPVRLDDARAPLLAQLPCLTRLHSDFGQCSSFDFLQRLPQLASLGLTRADQQPGSWPSALHQFSVGHLAQLRQLCISHTRCGEQELQLMLSHVPQLETLQLRSLGTVQSLWFLSAVPQLAASLTRLSLSFFGRQHGRFPSSELRYVHALLGLRQLRLTRAVLLDQFELSEYRCRPCAVLPQLASFSYDESELSAEW